MISKLSKIAAGLLLVSALSVPALATPISGSITFTGGVTMNTTSAGTATAVTGWFGAGGVGSPIVQGVTLDLDTYINPSDSVLFAAPWSFNSGAVSNFWKVGGFTFDLISSSIAFQGSGSVVVTGTGTLSGHVVDGFTPTLGSWSFTSQDPSAGTPAIFSFSAGSSVPDGGMTVVLLGVGLVLVGAVALRRQSLVRA